jgi:hypothetical protein
MSEFDKLKDQAGQEIKEHPEQVEEGEQAVEKKLGVTGQDDEKAKQDQGGQSRALLRR